MELGPEQVSVLDKWGVAALYSAPSLLVNWVAPV